MATGGSRDTHTATSSTGPVTVTAGPVTTTTTTTVTVTSSAGFGGASGRNRTALALDIGGTKLAGGVVDATGAVLGRARRAMPKTLDPEVTFAAAVECLHSALGDAGLGGRYDYAGLAGLGVGCGGPMIWPAGEVSPLNIPSWRDFPLRARLRDEFGGLGVLVHNDAVALAAGEHWMGTGRNTRNLLAVTVSTGVGGGLVLDGRLYHGRSGNAGHVGHLVVDPAGPDCACGGVGCLEAIASGPRTVAWAIEEGWKPVEAGPGTGRPGPDDGGTRPNEAGTGFGDSGPDTSGASAARGDGGGPDEERAPDGRALAASAAAGDKIARAALARSGNAVGIALASCAATFDLDLVTVAGGFSQSGPIFWDALRAAYDRHTGMEFARAVPVEPSSAPNDVALRGAAAFVLVPDCYAWAG
ncbi:MULTISPECIES: ROK family protein [unclassified Pseudofrankia]|uniref:ROK family protein n=1 Tax=unclassified Pseudofrankia TaxID=2994372 RepID=UPI0008DAB882|nr:ROK family protein [Pseudofrankia sp. BMG5.36]MDT3445857.1 ROK family protein [Pseudofrankia sp. BMG5.37]OHV51907.1 glucokinase [Pseudofrankia sp. BMG5.36]